MAEVLAKQGKVQEAIPLEERALAIRLKILGPVHVYRIINRLIVYAFLIG